MSKVALDGASVRARLEEVSALADLRMGHRLESKIGMSADAVWARLCEVSDLRALCLELKSAGRRASRR